MEPLKCSRCGHIADMDNPVNVQRLLCLNCALKTQPYVDVNSYRSIDTNDDGGKQSHIGTRFDLIDSHAIHTLAKILYEGAQKYDEDNWRKIDTRDHINHAVNHIYAHLSGNTDEEHLAHAFCRLMMAVAMEKQDDT